MSEHTPPPVPPTSEMPPPPAYAPPSYGGEPVAAGAPIGKVRSTGVSILLLIVTIGIYGLVWYFKVHKEMKNHTGNGLGGGLALLLAIIPGVNIVMYFLTPNEAGNMQARAGRVQTVSAVTGVWILLPLIGPIVWFVKVNGALNEYWRSLGAPA